MNVTALKAPEKKRTAQDGGFSNDNENWLANLPIGTTFYTAFAAMTSYTLHENTKAWQQGHVVALECSDGKRYYVHDERFCQAHVLIDIYKGEDTG